VTDQAECFSYPSPGPQPEAAAAVASTFKYRAFLSYSHRDTKWAKWLHNALEGLRIDKDLVGRETSFGPVPKTLRPIFRDRDDFSAGHSLTAQTLGALEASQFLIVLCSPHAARSTYVNEEIRHFKALGRTDRVIAVIVDGEPADPERECFPPAARFKLGSDGQLSGEREEPIAADVRPQGDGKQLTLSKVVAGLLGIGLDEVVRRTERARKRRNRIRIGAGGLAAAVVLGAAVGWWGALSVSSQLNNSELLNLARDAADICERGHRSDAAQNAPEARHIALALKCINVMIEGLGRLPPRSRLPQGVLDSFEENLAILRNAEVDRKLTSEQADVLHEADVFIEQFERR